MSYLIFLQHQQKGDKIDVLRDTPLQKSINHTSINLISISHIHFRHITRFHGCRMQFSRMQTVSSCLGLF